MQENQTQINPTNFNDNLASENNQNNKSNNLLKGFAFFVLLLAVATLFTGIGLYIGQQQTGKQMSNKTENQSDTTLTQKSDENQPNSENEKKSNQDLMFTYISNNALYLYKNGEKTKVSRDGEFLQTAQSIRFDISPNQMYVAYAYDIKTTEVNGIISTSPKKVALYHIGTAKHEDIFDLTDKDITYKNQEFVTQIINLKFSNNNEMIAIGSSHGIYIYNLDKKQIKQVVSNQSLIEDNPNDPTGKGMIFGYTLHSYSLDDSRIAYVEGMYEGGFVAIVDLKKGKSNRLANKSIGYGNSMAGFLGNDKFMLVEDYKNLVTYSINDNNFTNSTALEGNYYQTYDALDKIFFIYSYAKNKEYVEDQFGEILADIRVYDKKTMSLSDKKEIKKYKNHTILSIANKYSHKDKNYIIFNTMDTDKEFNPNQPISTIIIYDFDKEQYIEVIDL